MKIESRIAADAPPATFFILMALADDHRDGYAVIKDVAAPTVLFTR